MKWALPPLWPVRRSVTEGNCADDDYANGEHRANGDAAATQKNTHKRKYIIGGLHWFDAPACTGRVPMGTIDPGPKASTRSHRQSAALGLCNRTCPLRLSRLGTRAGLVTLRQPFALSGQPCDRRRAKPKGSPIERAQVERALDSLSPMPAGRSRSGDVININ